MREKIGAIAGLILFFWNNSKISLINGAFLTSFLYFCIFDKGMFYNFFCLDSNHRPMMLEATMMGQLGHKHSPQILTLPQINAVIVQQDLNPEDNFLK